MTDRHLRDARIKAQLRSIKRDERERCALACEQIGYDLLAADTRGQGILMQEAADYCVDACRALVDEA